MPRRPIVLPWTPEDVAKLQVMIAEGASAARGAAAMKRKIHAIQVKARALGTPFSPVRVERKKWQEPLKRSDIRPWRSI
jgi:hypothetical protein